MVTGRPIASHALVNLRSRRLGNPLSLGHTSLSCRAGWNLGLCNIALATGRERHNALLGQRFIGNIGGKQV